MSQTLLEKMVEEVKAELKKLRRPLKKGELVRLAYNTMRYHSSEIGKDWHTIFYSLVRALQNSPRGSSKENTPSDWRILQAAKLQEEELHRLNGIHYDEKLGCIFGLGECELDEAI